jgi:histidine ammonia-lyase
MTDQDLFILRPGQLTLADMHRLRLPGVRLDLDPASFEAIESSAACVAQVLAEGQVVYGINTGFGLLARQTIAADQVLELQRRLVLSHAAGVGAPLSDDVVRLVMALKINSLARGFSGVRRELLDWLIAAYNADLFPEVPGQGSVGASGDLAPLSHMAAMLLGEGRVRFRGEAMPASDGLRRAGLAPLALAAKEGLALLNGTQVSTALALEGLFQGLDLFAAALAAGALSLDAALGSDGPFDPRIHEARGQPGQIIVARLLRHLLAESGIRHSHLECDRVQDPYSLRCQPQVMGAVLDSMEQAARVLVREGNAVSDNPLVFAEAGEIISGGNFHAEPVAFAADALAVALSEVGAMSERRIALLTDPAMSELPAFLVAEPGLNSGFMIAHVTAAALAAENKTLTVPASVDSLPTSANQEDHVSMATHGARRLATIAANGRNIVAIELLAAAQGVDFRHPLETSPPLARVLAEIRARVPFRNEDRLFAPDMAAIEGLIAEGGLRSELSAQGDAAPPLLSLVLPG